MSIVNFIIISIFIISKTMSSSSDDEKLRDLVGYAQDCIDAYN